VWRICENNSCIFATYCVRNGGNLITFFLHERIWRYVHGTEIPAGFRVVTYNRDGYDLRA
jgi:hypothetical protein